MAAAKTAIKESLLGTERNPELSTQTKSTFDRNARQDESSDEAYMTEDDFINAIAPEGESYVRNSNQFPRLRSTPGSSVRRFGPWADFFLLPYSTR